MLNMDKALLFVISGPVYLLRNNWLIGETTRYLLVTSFIMFSVFKHPMTDLQLAICISLVSSFYFFIMLFPLIENIVILIQLCLFF